MGGIQRAFQLAHKINAIRVNVVLSTKWQRLPVDGVAEKADVV